MNYKLSPTYSYLQNVVNFGPQTAKTNCMDGAWRAGRLLDCNYTASLLYIYSVIVIIVM